MSIDKEKAERVITIINKAMQNDGWDFYSVSKAGRITNFEITNNDPQVNVLPQEVKDFVEGVLKRNSLSANGFTFRSAGALSL